MIVYVHDKTTMFFIVFLYMQQLLF